MPQTMFQKIWDAHVVRAEAGQPVLLYIDLHLVHEVTSPQAFEGLRLTGRTVRRPDLTVATMDHNVPTTSRSLPIVDQISKKQMETLSDNCKEFGVTLYDIHSKRQGIVHVIGPELGLTQPGMTIVCGDSHTSTHGAFGALAFGIGTSEVEHVLATQCLPQSLPKTMEIRVSGKLGMGVTAKDIILAIIGKIGTDGATGYVVEYTGEAIQSLSMDALRRYLQDRLLDQATINSLHDVLGLYERLERIAQQYAELEAQRKRIHEQQTQIRGNLDVLGSDGDEGELRTRYITTLAESEDALARLRAEELALRAEEQQRRQELEAYLRSFGG